VVRQSVRGIGLCAGRGARRGHAQGRALVPQPGESAVSQELLAPRAAPRRRSLARPAVRRLLPAALSLGCVGLLLALFWSRIPAVLRVMQDADYAPLGLALAAYLAAVCLQGVRIALVLRVFGILESVWRCFLFTLIGLFFG